MAPRINHDVKPTKIGPDAHDELERLLQSLHRHGALRLANDIVSANADVAQILVEGLGKPGSLNAVQNLSILLMALSSITPGQFYKLVFATRDALDSLSSKALRQQHGKVAPGVRGAYRMLHDDQLWSVIRPLIAALTVFAARMDKDIDKPISDFTAKPSSA